MTNPCQIYRLNPLVRLDSNSTQVYDALLDDLIQVRVASDDKFESSYIQLILSLGRSL